MVITGSDDDTLVADAVRAGAAAFLTKVFSMEELVSAIRMLAAGEVLLTTEVAISMLRELHHQDGDSPRLTNREEETLQLVATGLSTHDVARRLFISPKTVRNHLAAAYAKLDARDRTEAILSGMRLGIVALA
jgi:DNA-binding NarL/FixJ family response regulator